VGLEHFLARYGLIAVMLGAGLEGDMSLVIAGVLAHRGLFPLPLALAAGAAGTLLADCAWYGIGRLRGGTVRAGRLYRRVGPTIERLARRVGPWELIACRFVYGTRTASMVFWGLHGLGVGRFAAIDAVGCVLGAAVFSGAGYLLSGSVTMLLGRIHRVELVLAGAVVAAAVVVWAVNRVTRRGMHADRDDTAAP
jgi:membrane protein DedA with SNARE-associated domain